MLLLDVNVLIAAFRVELPHHEATRRWLSSLIADKKPFGLPDAVFCSVIRIVTRRPFEPVSTPAEALRFIHVVREAPSFRVIMPSESQWKVFTDLCAATDARGGKIQDLYWASFAIDMGCDFVTFDQGMADIPGLRWRSPLDNRSRFNSH
jgi:toxin-antitoxin system PIN domain toxin